MKLCLFLIWYSGIGCSNFSAVLQAYCLYASSASGKDVNEQDREVTPPHNFSSFLGKVWSVSSHWLRRHCGEESNSVRVHLHRKTAPNGDARWRGCGQVRREEKKRKEQNRTEEKNSTEAKRRERRRRDRGNTQTSLADGLFERSCWISFSTEGRVRLRGWRRVRGSSCKI